MAEFLDVCTDYPITDKINEKCEDCKYYAMIDSGYGWCLRFPPHFRFWIKWFKFHGADMYPEIPWNTRICGEFMKRVRRIKCL